MASLIRGITVTLYDRVPIGTDEFNAPVYEDTPVLVDNVLVSPVSSSPIVGESQMEGKRLECELCIPKKDANVWENRVVEFFGKKWHTIGFAQEWIEENLPLDWNRKIKVECYG